MVRCLNLAISRKYVLLVPAIALAVGCARVNLTIEPTSGAHNPVVKQNDANGVSTWAILPASYNPQIATPWIIYNHGFGQTISSIAENPPQNGFV